MKNLFTIDLKDYDGCTEFFRRPSARGIIITDDDKLRLFIVQETNIINSQVVA